MFFNYFLTLFRLAFWEWPNLGGGGGGEVPAAYNSKTVNDKWNEIWWSSKGSLANKFGVV